MICIEAVVEPDYTALQYTIHSFRNFDGIKRQPVSLNNILPDIKIRHKKINNARNWVHTDSEEVSLLSTIVGKAIEDRKIATA